MTQLSYLADGSTNPLVRFWAGTNVANTLVASYDLSPGSNANVLVNVTIPPLYLTAGEPYTVTLQDGPLSSSNDVIVFLYFSLQPAPEITAYDVELLNYSGTFTSLGTNDYFFGVNFSYEVPFQINSIARQSNDMRITWQAPAGSTNALQMTTGTVGGSYATNNFTDIFIVTNSASMGGATNYLDSGAATNSSRYYRVRLVP